LFHLLTELLGTLSLLFKLLLRKHGLFPLPATEFITQVSSLASFPFAFFLKTDLFLQRIGLKLVDHEPLLQRVRHQLIHPWIVVGSCIKL
jgi:hypothetical protein